MKTQGRKQRNFIKKVFQFLNIKKKKEVKQSVTTEILSKPFLGLFGGIFTASTEYLDIVERGKYLAENDSLFKRIISKLIDPINNHPTSITFFEDRNKIEQEIVDNLIIRIKWDDLKTVFLKQLLLEGGASGEVIVEKGLGKSFSVAGLKPRNHYQIEKVTRKEREEKGYPEYIRYKEIDVTSDDPDVFAEWQIADVNLVESSFHTRGVPHIQGMLNYLHYTDQMTKGLMQKWMRESGSIEHFNVGKDAGWREVERFQEMNRDSLLSSPENLVRQFFSAGETKIDRIATESSTYDNNSIELILELIFLSCGVPKEVLGFKSHTIIQDMVDLAMDNYFQFLAIIQKTLFKILEKVVELELLFHHRIPEEFNYSIVGARFEAKRQIQSYSKEVFAANVLSPNEIRRSCGLDPVKNPLWDKPGATPFVGEMRSEDIVAEEGISA